MQTLQEAVGRLEELAYRTICPTSKLIRLLSIEKADESVMAANISRATQIYTTELEKMQEDEPAIQTEPRSKVTSQPLVNDTTEPPEVGRDEILRDTTSSSNIVFNADESDLTIPNQKIPANVIFATPPPSNPDTTNTNNHEEELAKYQMEVQELKQIVERLTTGTQYALPITSPTLKTEVQPCALPDLKKTPGREVVEVLSDD